MNQTNNLDDRQSGELAPGPICQSCGMPLSGDPMGGGVERDGTRSKEFCSFCYENGAFRDPEIKLSDFVARLQAIMGDMKMPPEVAERTISILPTLRRWRN